MLRNLTSKTTVMLASLLLLAVAAQAQITTYTSRAAFGASDTVDWGGVGTANPDERGFVVPSPFSNLSSLKSHVVISGSVPGGSFIRYNEGLGWHGNFSPGDRLLLTNGTTGAFTIAFTNGAVFGAGMQVQLNGVGPFTATLKAFDSFGALLAKTTVSGVSSSPLVADNTAPFVGFKSRFRNISFLQISVSSGVAASFAVNQMAVTTTPTLVAQKLGDLDGDARTDIVWRNSLTGADAAWLMNGGTPTISRLAGASNVDWQIVGVGDFNFDGKADLLWHNSASGGNAVWLMNGISILSINLLPTVGNLDWHIVGIGDLDGDGKADIVWRNVADGENAVWLMNGASVLGIHLLPSVGNKAWQIAGIGDLDGDRKADIVWRNSVGGQNAVWLMNGASVLSINLLGTVSDMNWQIVGVGDLNGDGRTDILWRNADGENVLWLMTGASILSIQRLFGVGNRDWQIAAIGDVSGDGNADIIWRNSVNGENAVWIMSGGTVLSINRLPTLGDQNWRIY